ncbi:unnamed protein product [Chondrus crispus]|uniref:Uncharacterized protein n=1 Tax=Chondrus crispus TaxID=2769 RepID=R7QCL6_CHOCR|nr:unnamed protein product [Chondrus crispus]CDF36257.1 unnamed protein product [Chondrus crispus]|eukprot:XP_005716076.1 unnamed protein product [Chondrus crispus]
MCCNQTHYELPGLPRKPTNSNKHLSKNLRWRRSPDIGSAALVWSLTGCMQQCPKYDSKHQKGKGQSTHHFLQPESCPASSFHHYAPPMPTHYKCPRMPTAALHVNERRQLGYGRTSAL